MTGSMGETTRSGRGHPIMGAIFGLLFGIFLAMDLLLIDAFPVDSILVYVLPLLGVVGGAGLGAWAPLRLGRT